MADSDTDTGITRQGKMIFVGVIFIVWGIIGALWSYYSDSDSFDLIRMLDASENAIVHAVIWIAAGGGIIAWYTIGPGSSRGSGSDDDDNRRNQIE
jgi:hypothetical protein